MFAWLHKILFGSDTRSARQARHRTRLHARRTFLEPLEPRRVMASAYLAFDHGNAGSSEAPGYHKIIPSDVYTTTNGFGWESSGMGAGEFANTGLSDLTRDFNHDDVGNTFKIDVVQGLYDVGIIVGHDTMALSDVQVTIGSTTPFEIDRAAGSFYDSINSATPRRVTMLADGTLPIAFEDMGTADDLWVTSAIKVTPLITSYARQNLVYHEGDPALHMLAGTTKVHGTKDYRGGSLTVQYNSGSGTFDRLELNTNADTGLLSVELDEGTTAYDGTLKYDGLRIGAFSGGVASSSLVINFDDSATNLSPLMATAVEKVLRAATDHNTNDTQLANSSRKLQFVLVDSASTVISQEIALQTVNDAPIANDDSYSVNEDSQLNATTVLANDTDVDDTLVTAEIVSQPTFGVVVFNPNGTFTYTPDANRNGTDTFTYKAYDTEEYSEPAIVSITINPVNDAPVATGDYLEAVEDGAFDFEHASLLSNDNDVDCDPVTLLLASGPLHGTITVPAPGWFNYTPNVNYRGPDSFTYRATDGTSQSAPVTVNLNVLPGANGEPYRLLLSGDSVATEASGELRPIISITPAPPAGESITVRVQPEGSGSGSGYAVPVSDFNAAPIDLVFDSENLERVAPIPLTADGIQEGKEYFGIEASIVSDAADALYEAEFAIVDDRPLYHVSFSEPAVEASSEEMRLEAWITPAPAVGDPVTVLIETRDLGAEGEQARLGIDYEPVSLEVTFDHTGARIPIAIPLIRTGLLSDPKQLQVRATVLSHDAPRVFTAQPTILAEQGEGSGNARVSGSNTGTEYELQVTHSPSRVNENGTIDYTVQLNPPLLSGDSVAVQFRARQSSAAPAIGLANEGSDFSVASQGVSFSTPGQYLATFSVPIFLDSDTGEPEESFFIEIEGWGYQDPGDGSAWHYVQQALLTDDATIIDDDATVAPVAVDDDYSVLPEALLTVSGTGVLGNDTYETPAHAQFLFPLPSSTQGTVTAGGRVVNPRGFPFMWNFDGGFVFEPANGFTGDVTLSYKIISGSLESAPATITIHVMNRAPSVEDASFTIGRGVGSTFGHVSASDPDVRQTLTYALEFAPGSPANGVFSIDNDGRLSAMSIPATMTEATFDVVVTDSGDAVLSDTATVTVTIASSFPGYLAQVDYLDNLTIHRDPGSPNEGVPYPSVEYSVTSTDPEGAVPIAYTSTTAIKANVSITVPSVNGAPPPELSSPIRIRGVGPDIVFTERTASVQLGSGTTPSRITVNGIIGSAFGAIRNIPAFDVSWEVSINNGPWFSAGTSTNWMHVTLAEHSVSDELYRTLVHLATANANGSTSSLDAVSGIFFDFQDLEVRTWDGNLLIYGHDPAWASGYYKTYALLKNEAGPCDLWASFFTDLLGVHGIDGDVKRIRPIWGHGFVIDNARFYNPGSGYRPSDFLHHLGTDCTLQGPLPGQGRSTSAGQVFKYHDVVTWSGLILDPAYGTTFLSLSQWENANLAGTYFQVSDWRFNFEERRWVNDDGFNRYVHQDTDTQTLLTW